MRRGLIMAGGRGTRLYPATRGTNKHLLPIYNKPMIYYPLSVLMLAGIREIGIVTNEHDIPQFERMLGSGSAFGLEIRYLVQDAPVGIADAYRVGRSFVGNEPSALILGDNVFFGIGLSQTLQTVTASTGATVFAVPVKDPRQFGIVTLNSVGEPMSLEEKPGHPLSNLAVTGLYFLDSLACQYAAEIKPSSRGELEITDLLSCYLEVGQLSVRRIGRGTVWMDAGTPESLLDITNFVAAVERRQGLRIGCLEEIALRKGWLSESEFAARIDQTPHGAYRDYLVTLAESNLDDVRDCRPSAIRRLSSLD